ncbi:hypothetical protein ITJ57_00615 [Plantibacter sp. VKM Ac-2880]|uniref:hypothetical protein n=1 Tax=unclassified Plantibacter TaxID=2624265 RepID=UPI00188DDBAA|nr:MULTISPECIES: hypothetical protein [unclassified Plantibacter]MBF4567253.1 hypothetical protein [Plantibacter sp. VKM Ac-2880]
MDIGTIVILAALVLLAVGAVWYVVRRDRAAHTTDQHHSAEGEAEHVREMAKARAQSTGVIRRGGGPTGV